MTENENPAPAGPYYVLPVARVIDETPDARSLVLEIPDSLRDTFRYRAGQFLTFRVPVGEQRLVRCYSLSSCPESGDETKVTVKRVDDGRVSNWMNDSVEAGSTLEVMHPAGHFCLGERQAPIWMFSGGSGITPVISIIKSALVTTARSVRLLYANRDSNSIIFRDELEALAARHPDRFSLSHSLDEVDGFVDDAAVRTRVSGSLDSDFYICGPGPFMDVVEGALQGLGVEADRIFIERFEYAAAVGAAEDVGAGDAPEGTVQVSLDGQTREVPYRSGETILAASRRAGMDPPSACEEGYCGCCMARVKEGRVEMKLNDGGIDERQESEGWVLTCQGVAATGVCRVEYPD